MTEKKAYLYLDPERFFEGFSVGKNTDTCGEVVFNTSMCGYQEIISDPSYTDQIINFTYPHIGNVGTNDDDLESNANGCNGVIIRDPSTITSSWRKQNDLSDFLKTKNISGIYGIDTRKVTRIIRNEGAKIGAIVSGKDHKKKALKLIEEFVPLAGKDLASGVSTKKAYEWKEPSWRKEFKDNSLKIVAIDFGVKHNILRMLKDRGFQVIVVPAKTTAEEIMAMKPDGVFLSNGPGDPEPCTYAIKCIRELRIQRIPIFGICLGHQLLGLALGMKTVKMKFGHHGANHPVKDLDTNRVFITSQNHGFTIDSKSIPEDVKITHLSLFDETIQGIETSDKRCFSFQGHPEASPGPQEIQELFDKFLTVIKSNAKKK